jgi:hypothetical protein
MTAVGEVNAQLAAIGLLTVDVGRRRSGGSPLEKPADAKTLAFRLVRAGRLLVL